MSLLPDPLRKHTFMLEFAANLGPSRVTQPVISRLNVNELAVRSLMPVKDPDTRTRHQRGAGSGL